MFPGFVSWVYGGVSAGSLNECLDLRLGAWDTIRDGPPARPPLSENAAAAAPQLRLLKAKAKA